MDASHVGVLAVFFGSSLALFDLKQEGKWAMGTLISYSALALIAQYVLSPLLAIAEESVTTHLPLYAIGMAVSVTDVVYFASKGQLFRITSSFTRSACRKRPYLLSRRT
jgi:hypothetical protein